MTSNGNWRKSSYSSTTGGQCVEVATARKVLVRDTTDRGGVTLSISHDAWLKFINATK